MQYISLTVPGNGASAKMSVPATWTSSLKSYRLHHNETRNTDTFQTHVVHVVWFPHPRDVKLSVGFLAPNDTADPTIAIALKRESTQEITWVGRTEAVVQGLQQCGYEEGGVTDPPRVQQRRIDQFFTLRATNLQEPSPFPPATYEQQSTYAALWRGDTLRASFQRRRTDRLCTRYTWPATGDFTDVFPFRDNHVVDAVFAYQAVWNAKPEVLMMMDDRFPYTLDDLSRAISAYPQHSPTFAVKPDDATPPRYFVSVVHAWRYFSKCAEMRSRTDWSEDDSSEHQAHLNDLHLHQHVTLEQIPQELTTHALFANNACAPYQANELDVYSYNTWVDQNGRRAPPTLWRLRQAKFQSSPVLRYVFFQMPWTAVQWVTTDEFRGADLEEFRGWYMCQEWLKHYSQFPAWVCTEDPASMLTRDMVYGLLRSDVSTLDGDLVAHLVQLFGQRPVQWIPKATDIAPIASNTETTTIAVWCGDHALLWDPELCRVLVFRSGIYLSAPPELPSFQLRLGLDEPCVETMMERFPDMFNNGGMDYPVNGALMGLLQWALRCPQWTCPPEDKLPEVRQQLVQDVLLQRVSRSYWIEYFDI